MNNIVIELTVLNNKIYTLKLFGNMMAPYKTDFDLHFTFIFSPVFSNLCLIPN